MIVIATEDEALASRWQQALHPKHEIYDLILQDIRSLEICLKKVQFDILILDKKLLGTGGVHEISNLHELQPDLNIIVMTPDLDEREEIAIILFGAKAYCQYQTDLALLPKIIETVLSNELWVDRKFVTRLLSEIEDIAKAQHQEAKSLDAGLASLTPRETEIAKWVGMGASNRKIAEQLNISERTVKAHLGVIFRKMKVNDRLQLALYINRHQQIGAIWHHTDSDTH